jgi:hypothetical protein
MNVGLIMALVKGGKAILLSKPVRLALARYILDSVEKHEPKPEAK